MLGLKFFYENKYSDSYRINNNNNSCINNYTNLVLAVEDGVECQLLLAGGTRGALLVVASAAGRNLLGTEDCASAPSFFLFFNELFVNMFKRLFFET